MTTGLTIGKFAPFHKGHEYLIESALKVVDRLIVIVYDAPKQTKIPLEVRASWIKTIYPETIVIKADQVPKDVGYTEAIQQKHVAYILSLVESYKVDFFFSSEAYGEKMSDALGAKNILVDHERTFLNISGTEIRKDIKAYKDYLHPIVFEAIKKYDCK